MKSVLSALFLLSLLLCSCEKPKDYYISFYNDSNMELLVGHGPLYPTDSLGGIRGIKSLDLGTLRIPPLSSVVMRRVAVEKRGSWYIDFYNSQINYSGYISFYIGDAAVFEKNDENTLVDNYMLLARYDIKQEDIENLDWKISYPPTGEMQGIHMWLTPGTVNN